jgi:hypothetical protein
MENKNVPGEAKAVKPTLMSRPSLTPVTDDQEHARILSTVKAQPVAKAAGSPGQKNSTLKTLAVLSFGAAAAFFGYQYLSGSANQSLLADATLSSRAKASIGKGQVIEEKAEAAPVIAAIAPAVVAAPQDTASAAVAPQAALIVNEPTVAKVAPPVSAESKLSAALEAGVKPQKATAPKAPETKEPATKARSAAKAPETPVVAEKKPPAPVTKDKDINLLAALITHNNTTATTPTAVNSAVAARATPQPAAQKSSSSTSTDKTASTDSTESALKRCSELGFFDREVCRVKTCNDLWETNAACKASLSRNAGTTADAQRTAASKANAATTEKPTTGATSTASAATELQLKQCSELWPLDRLSCRIKACSGQWETNAACKAFQ